MKRDISKAILWLVLLATLCGSIAFGQNNFFKYSTFYTSMSMNTSMIENQDYIAVNKGNNIINKYFFIIKF